MHSIGHLIDCSQVLPVTAHLATKPAEHEHCYVEFDPCAHADCDRKFGPWCEDVNAQSCMDHHSVDEVAANDVATDGACHADGPEDATGNSNWHSIDCSQVLPVTAHLVTKPAEYEHCHAEFGPCAHDDRDRQLEPWGDDVNAQSCMDHHSVD